ncbi:MAG: aminotransferase class IV [Haloplanus sp.]
MQYHVDGALVDADAATVSVDSRVATAGDAVTEPVRAYAGTPFAWDAHAERLFGACDALGIDPGVDAATLHTRVEATLTANDLDEALVRVSILREGREADPPLLAGRLRPPADADPTVVVTVTPLSDVTTDDAVTLQTVRTRAIPPASVPAASVTHNRLDAVCAQAELRRAAPPDGDPAAEALLLDAEGQVVGGTASDPIFVDDEAVRMPALGDRTARTATRSVVRDIAAAESFPIVEDAYTPADLRDAAEAFLAEPTAGIRPVDRIDGIDVGGGPVTDLLARLFEERVTTACRG